MRNIQTRNFKADEDALAALLSKAKTEQRSDDALSVSFRLTATASAWQTATLTPA